MYHLQIILDGVVQRQFMVISSTFCVSGTLIGILDIACIILMYTFENVLNLALFNHHMQILEKQAENSET